MARARALCHDACMPPTVLIVDDHPSFRATARALLEAEGFDVVGEAENGADALAKAAAFRPDLVLLDVQLPDLDGFAIATRLCAAGDGAPAVILVSSRDASDYGDLIPACGARGFVAKGDLSGAAVRSILA
jgi:DNA-binding NarL/FixJ family response regulator